MRASSDDDPLLFETSGFGFELELPRIVANHADLVVSKAGGRFGFDVKRERDLRALCALKLHHHRIEDRIERLDRPNHVDLDRAVEPAILRLNFWQFIVVVVRRFHALPIGIGGVSIELIERFGLAHKQRCRWHDVGWIFRPDKVSSLGR